MPPKSKLSGFAVDVLTKWVAASAPWPKESTQATAIRSGPMVWVVLSRAPTASEFELFDAGAGE